MSTSSPDTIEYFNVVGTYRITPEALRLAGQLVHSASVSLPQNRWVICYEWFFSSRERRGKESPWIDKGSGLDIGGYRVGEVPSACVQILDGIAVAAKIPKEILDAAPARTIDVDPAGATSLRLI